MKCSVYLGVESEEEAGVYQGKKLIPVKGSSICKGARLWDGPVFGKNEKYRGAGVYSEEVGRAILQMKNLKLRWINEGQPISLLPTQEKEGKGG